MSRHRTAVNLLVEAMAQLTVSALTVDTAQGLLEAGVLKILICPMNCDTLPSGQLNSLSAELKKLVTSASVDELHETAVAVQLTPGERVGRWRRRQRSHSQEARAGGRCCGGPSQDKVG